MRRVRQDDDSIQTRLALERVRRASKQGAAHRSRASFIGKPRYELLIPIRYRIQPPYDGAGCSDRPMVGRSQHILHRCCGSTTRANPMSAVQATLPPPSAALRLLEVRVVPEFGAFWLMRPWLS